MSNQLLMRRRALMLGKKKDNILTFTAEADNSSVKLTAVGSPNPVTLEYNLNGAGWLPYTIGDTISLSNVGDNVKLRGNNSTFSKENNNCYKFVLTGLIAASGDITSLMNSTGGDMILTSGCFSNLFKNCDKLSIAPNLPSTTLANYCYYDLFHSCKGLTVAPALPATIMADYCYSGMFDNCLSLAIAPKLPATTLATRCYQYMFEDCKSLIEVELPATTLAYISYYNMFRSCTNLTDVTAHFENNVTTTNLQNWLFDVAASGTLTCPAGVTLESGISGLPSGWTRVDL